MLVVHDWFDRSRSVSCRSAASVPHVKGQEYYIANTKERLMITVCIRYTLDVSKLADFEGYSRLATSRAMWRQVRRILSADQDHGAD